MKKNHPVAKNNYQKARVVAQKAAGLCVYPGCTQKPVEGRSKCEKHMADARRHAENARYAKKKKSL